MHRPALTALFGLTLTAISATALAGDWKFLPVRDTNFKPDMTLSLAAGTLNTSKSGSGNYGGVELAFNCLALQPPTGVIRTKISLGEYDHNNLKLSSFEINPRWTLNLNENLTVGVGPGVGYVKAETGGQSTSLAALQAGVDLDYRVGALNLGLGARWQDTRNKQITPGVNGTDNSLIQAKIGINF